ncbi:MAG: GAK system CofD-like protein [Desulfonatronovibrionaceae bacterium]
MRIQITRETEIPDKYKLARFREAPALGPKILFFSGGSALRDVSRNLINYTHNSIHIITPFDSGGSSAVLRKAFNMPAVGDIRNRLMALADQSIKGNPEIFNLFSHRLPKDREQDELKSMFYKMVRGRNTLVASVPDPMRKIIRHHLEVFWDNMPGDFDLRGASIGNLVLAAGYLENKGHMDPVIYIYSKLVEVRGVVRPVVNSNLHLAGRLENGEILTGQHNLTGKEVPKLKQRIDDLFLVPNLESKQSVNTQIREKISKKIRKADLICYPMGSFFTSIIANLLPYGVGKAIGEAKCPKVFIPNTAKDPECHSLTLSRQLQLLMHILMQGCGNTCSNGDLLNFIVLDRNHSLYLGGVDKSRILQFGVEILEYGLVTEKSTPYIDPEKLCEVLLSTC